MKIRFGEFKTNCDNCDALCCTELSIINYLNLGESKQAGIPCKHLGEDRRCQIYGKRSIQGFGVCGEYDCLGAGPLTTQIFGGLKIDIESSQLDNTAKQALLEKWHHIRRECFQDLQKVFSRRSKRGEKETPSMPGDIKTIEDLISEGVERFVEEVKQSGVRLVCSASEFN